VISLKFSRTMHLHAVPVKLMNCDGEIIPLALWPVAPLII